jgi:hypothetical protein
LQSWLATYIYSPNVISKEMIVNIGGQSWFQIS